MLLKLNHIVIYRGKIQSFTNSKTPIAFILAFVFLSLINCSCDRNDKLFRLRKSSQTGLTFNNTITISDSLNAVTFEYIYNGGGAAVGDVNNDGLKDLFFAGNMVSSRLYLNQGELKFKDITELSGTLTDSWCTGVSFVDINNDGWLDLYICVAGLVKPAQRRNIFFINEGTDENGIPHFVNKASEMGIDDDGYSTMAVFFDYDKDHDLDMYLLTNSMKGEQRNMIKPIKIMGESETTDRLYRNNGDGSFTNWSKEAGILKEGFGLGVGLCDINQDNWTDVYCANDFISSDLLWINNQDGTFSEQAGKYFKHFTNNGMGMDVADYNNDALLDFIVLDMMPVTNLRQKLMFGFRSTERFNSSLEMGYLPQFLRNTLQLNMGKFPDGQFHFSEIAFLANVYQTDWSWSPLFVDFDNDGWKDLLITNGYRKDVTNLDYITKIIRETRFGDKETKRMKLLDAMNNLDDVKLSNFIFKNNKDLTFTDKSEAWKVNSPSFTNGTIAADLDNDGDLDIVLNNIDQEVHLYENKAAQLNRNHYLTLRFDPNTDNSNKIGTKIWVFQKDNHQYFEYSPYRGYKSTVDSDIHIGLGQDGLIDSLFIQWPDGSVQSYNETKCDTTLILSKFEALPFFEGNFISHFDNKAYVSEVFFQDITDSLNIVFKHVENSYHDFIKTPNLLRSLSKNGPSLCVGDINKDGLEDIFIGSDNNLRSSFLVQQKDHTFSFFPHRLDSIYEDMGSLLFDADSDGDLDLYVVSGGSQWEPNSSYYQDRLYLNQDQGEFLLANEALPQITASGSCVTACDYDGDGDLDLFVGGRLVPTKYPSIPQSYLLENDGNGKFTNRSDLLGSTSGKLGMVTSALWTDINNDSIPDLLIVGEWMNVTVLINKNNMFEDQSVDFKLLNTSGWWNSVNGGDFDNDGDIDYIVGNYGLNSFYKASIDKPLEIYAKDFDRNGSFDPIVTNYVDGESYIVHARNVLVKQIPGIENRFFSYESYGKTPFSASFTKEELENSVHFDCKMMQTIILENVNGKEFVMHDLPNEVQFSPIFGSITEDFNNDNRLDLVLIGNSMADETFAGYYDASYGSILINNGNFNWIALDPTKTKFIASGDKKALVKININGKPVYVSSENDGPLQAYSGVNLDLQQVQLADANWFYQLDYQGLKRKEELYYGSGYLSSHSRIIYIPNSVNSLSIYNYNGSVDTLKF